MPRPVLVKLTVLEAENALKVVHVHKPPKHHTPRMKHRTRLPACLAAAFCLSALIPTPASAVEGWATTRVRENLNRGVHAQYTGGTAVHVSWRLLETDDAAIAFDVYRRVGTGSPVKLNTAPLTVTTDFLDTTAPTGSDVFYHVVPIVAGRSLAPSAEGKVNTTTVQNYVSINVGGTVGKVGIGDLDGDGAYDYVVRTPDGSIDPAGDIWHSSGYTYKLKAFKSDGTALWAQPFDLGWNIEAGVWYSPFIVYDFDGDGKAEVAAKTAPMSPDYRDANGRVDTGPEYLSIINGETGVLVTSINWPDRTGITSYNHRSRNQLGVAFVDGKTPCIIAARGTYSLMKAMAVQYTGGVLSTLWNWNSNMETTPSHWMGQGAHSMHAADVDGDGRDEVMLGSAVLNDTGMGLWTNRLAHCDHAYLGDIDPNRPGLEVYFGYEDGRSVNGWNLSDAANGSILWGSPSQTYHIHDEGLVADLTPDHDGMEMYSGEKDYDVEWFHAADSTLISHNGLFFDDQITYRAAYWDADLQREAIVRNTVYNFPTSPVTVFYSEPFNDWWNAWQIWSSDGQASRGASDGNATVSQNGNGNWTLRPINGFAAVSGDKYRITAYVQCENSVGNFAVNVTGLNGSTVVGTLVTSPTITGTKSRTELTASFTVPPGVNVIRPFFSGAKGQFTINDLTLVKDDDPNRGLATPQGNDVAWADIHGDWREEIITSYGSELRIYSTTIPAADRRVTLMQDRLYRSDVAHVAMGYEQVPTTSYCLAQPVGQNQMALNPVADVLARGGQYAGQNFGTGTELGSKDGSDDVDRRSYLRFNLNAVPSGKTITKATLRMRVTNSHNPVNTIHFVSTDSWGETTLTWANKPAHTATALASKTVPNAGQWLEFDVTGVALQELDGDGLLSLALVSTLNANSMMSSSEGANPPHLLLETADVSGSFAPVIADAYVRDGSGYTTQNFGAATELVVKKNDGNGNNRIAYLKFDVSAVPANVSSAFLVFDVLSDSTTGGGTPMAVHTIASDSWIETGTGQITWSNKPALVSVLATGSVEGGTTAQVDITPEVQAAAASDDILSVAINGISGNTNNFFIGSKEGGAPARIYYTQ